MAPIGDVAATMHGRVYLVFRIDRNLAAAMHRGVHLIGRNSAQINLAAAMNGDVQRRLFGNAPSASIFPPP